MEVATARPWWVWLCSIHLQLSLTYTQEQFRFATRSSVLRIFSSLPFTDTNLCVKNQRIKDILLTWFVVVAQFVP